MRKAIFTGRVASKNQNIKKFTYNYTDRNGNQHSGNIYKFQAGLPNDRGKTNFVNMTVFNHDGFMKYVAQGTPIEGWGDVSQTSKQQQDGTYRDYFGIVASSITFGCGSTKEQNEKYLNRAGGANNGNGGQSTGNNGNNGNNGGSAPQDPFANDANSNANNAPQSNANNGSNSAQNPFASNSNSANSNANSGNGNANGGNGNSTGNGNGNANGNGKGNNNGNKKLDISDDDLPF